MNQLDRHGQGVLIGEKPSQRALRVARQEYLNTLERAVRADARRTTAMRLVNENLTVRGGRSGAYSKSIQAQLGATAPSAQQMRAGIAAVNPTATMQLSGLTATAKASSRQPQLPYYRSISGEGLGINQPDSRAALATTGRSAYAQARNVSDVSINWRSLYADASTLSLSELKERTARIDSMIDVANGQSSAAEHMNAVASGLDKAGNAASAAKLQRIAKFGAAATALAIVAKDFQQRVDEAAKFVLQDKLARAEVQQLVASTTHSAAPLQSRGAIYDNMSPQDLHNLQVTTNAIAGRVQARVSAITGTSNNAALSAIAAQAAVAKAAEVQLQRNIALRQAQTSATSAADTSVASNANSSTSPSNANEPSHQDGPSPFARAFKVLIGAAVAKKIVDEPAVLPKAFAVAGLILGAGGVATALTTQSLVASTPMLGGPTLALPSLALSIPTAPSAASAP